MLYVIVNQAPKGKRNAGKSKKRQKSGSFEDDSNGRLNRQSSNSYSSEDESNLSLELNNGRAISSTTLNSSGKTRASRGSATDPQSLYARVTNLAYRKNCLLMLTCFTSMLM